MPDWFTEWLRGLGRKKPEEQISPVSEGVTAGYTPALAQKSKMDLLRRKLRTTGMPIGEFRGLSEPERKKLKGWNEEFNLKFGKATAAGEITEGAVGVGAVPEKFSLVMPGETAGTWNNPIFNIRGVTFTPTDIASVALLAYGGVQAIKTGGSLFNRATANQAFDRMATEKGIPQDAQYEVAKENALNWTQRNIKPSNLTKMSFQEFLTKGELGGAKPQDIIPRANKLWDAMPIPNRSALLKQFSLPEMSATIPFLQLPGGQQSVLAAELIKPEPITPEEKLPTSVEVMARNMGQALTSKVPITDLYAAGRGTFPVMESGEQIASKIGARFDGIQEGIGNQFTDPKTGSTFYGQTTEKAKLNLENMRAKFVELPKGLDYEQYKEAQLTPELKSLHQHPARIAADTKSLTPAQVNDFIKQTRALAKARNTRR
jgi:hypothetical protein